MGYSGAGLTLLTLAQPPSSPDLDPVVFLLLLLISAFSHTCLHLLVPMDAALFFFFPGAAVVGQNICGQADVGRAKQGEPRKFRRST